MNKLSSTFPFIVGVFGFAYQLTRDKNDIFDFMFWFLLWVIIWGIHCILNGFNYFKTHQKYISVFYLVAVLILFFACYFGKYLLH